MRLTTKPKFKKYLWEIYAKKANVMVSKSGKVTRIDVSGPVAQETVIASMT